MPNNKTNTYMMWTLKILAAAYQTPATATVFFNEFDNRTPLFQYITTILAVLLIDMLLIVTLWKLENSSIDPIERGAWVFAAIFLTSAVVYIGFLDEGGLAWGPRIGIITIVLVDIIKWMLDLLRQYYSRDEKEKRIRNRIVLYRSRKMETAQKAALDDLAGALQRLHYQREVERLNMAHLLDDQPVISDLPLLVEHTPKLVESGEPVLTAIEGVYRLANGYFGWTD
jgi:hypothetical protein